MDLSVMFADVVLWPMIAIPLVAIAVLVGVLIAVTVLLVRVFGKSKK